MRKQAVAAAVLVLAISLWGAACASPKPAPVYSATDPAGKTACWAIETQTETTVQSYLMQHPEYRMPMRLEALVSAGVLKEAPVCPAGGDYAWNPTSGGELWCSIHQHQ